MPGAGTGIGKGTLHELGFRTPLVPVVPILGILVCGLMMAALPWDTWLRLVVWLAIGFVVYFGYSVKHAKY